MHRLRLIVRLNDCKINDLCRETLQPFCASASQPNAADASIGALRMRIGHRRRRKEALGWELAFKVRATVDLLESARLSMSAHGRKQTSDLSATNALVSIVRNT